MEVPIEQTLLKKLIRGFEAAHMINVMEVQQREKGFNAERFKHLKLKKEQLYDLVEDNIDELRELNSEVSLYKLVNELA